MKKIFLLIAVVVAMSLQTMAQRRGTAPNWISIAAKAGYGNSVLLCKQINDMDNVTQNYLSPSFSMGGRLGVVFVDKIGVSLEYLSSQYQNKYEFDPQLGNKTINSNLRFKTGDLLILARYTGEYGFFAELGPKLTSVKEVTREVDNFADFDATNQFKGKFNSVVFGFGFTPYNGERVLVSLGLRLAYCSKNIVENDVNILGVNAQLTNVEMKPLSAQVTLDVNYHFARFGKATCGKQRIIFFK